MQPLPPREIVRLRHMQAAADKAIAYTQGRQRSILDTEEMRALALVRLVEIVGEAARAISDSTRARYPSIPWRQIVGTRDRLIHGYESVDHDVLWSIVTHDLPALVAEIERLLNA